MKIAIITTGYLPVPPSKGGAVENLTYSFIKENEINKQLDITLYSIYDKKSQQMEYSENTEFIKVSWFIKICDMFIYFIVKYILRKEKTNSYRYILQRLRFLKKVSKKISKKNFDRIVLENHYTEFLVFKWYNNFEKYKDKIYYHAHNESSGAYGCEEYIKNTKFLCVSDYIRMITKEKYNFINSDDLYVLHNCVDNKYFNSRCDFNKNEICAKYQIPLDKKIILFTGRLNREKGIIELIEAVSKINRDDFKLIIVGNFFYNTKVKSKFSDELDKLIKQNQSKIIFTGYVDYEDIHKLYKIADFSVLPSIWDDPAPLTIIESLQCGLPLITTYSGGIPEYAKEDYAILLERDEKLVDNLVSKIIYLLDNPSICEEMSKKCIEATKDWSSKKMFNDFVNLLNLEENYE